MTFGKVLSPATIIIFGVAVSIVFFMRASCEASELFYEPACDNYPIIYKIPPEFPSQNRPGYEEYDNRAAFESPLCYFLERHESSPPF